MTSFVPQRLGPYVLLSPLGEGDVAETFRAKLAGPQGPARTLAIKRVRPFYANDSTFVSTFLSEAQSAIGLSHPNIVSIFEAAAIGDAVFIASELIAGRTLQDVAAQAVKKGEPLSPVMVAFIVSEVAAALHHAHTLRSRGTTKPILHRNVGPTNILVSFDGEVKVTDFGISSAKSHLTQTQAGLARGKCTYMAPEQISGQTADAKADQFALGAVMWELLARRSLFEGATDYETIRNIMSLEVPSLRASNVPAELDRIVLRALARNPNERFASLGELHRELVKWMSESGSRASVEELRAAMRQLFASEIAASQAIAEADDRAYEAFVSGAPLPSPVSAARSVDPDPSPRPELLPPRDEFAKDEVTRPWRPRRTLGIDGEESEANTAEMEAMSEIERQVDRDAATKVLHAVPDEPTPPRGTSAVRERVSSASLPGEPEPERGGSGVAIVVTLVVLAAIGGAIYYFAVM